MNDPHRPLTPTSPMGFGEMLDRTIQLCRQAWRPLLLLGLLGTVPTLIRNLLSAPIPVSYSTRQFVLAAFTYQNQPGGTAGLFLFQIANFLMGLFVEGALILFASQLILGQPINVRSGLQTSFRKLPALFGTSFFVGLAYLLAAFLLFIISFVLPTPYLLLPLAVGGLLYVSLIYVFKGQVLLLEGLDGGRPPLRRSKQLVQTRFWPIAGFTILLGVGTTLVSFGWSLLLHLPVGMLNGVAWQDEAIRIASLIEVLPRTLTVPAVTIGTTLLYFDLRTRQEGLDLTPTTPPNEPDA